MIENVFENSCDKPSISTRRNKGLLLHFVPLGAIESMTTNHLIQEVVWFMRWAWTNEECQKKHERSKDCSIHWSPMDMLWWWGEAWPGDCSWHNGGNTYLNSRRRHKDKIILWGLNIWNKSNTSGWMVSYDGGTCGGVEAPLLLHGSGQKRQIIYLKSGAI